jgi:hypothetical protein
MPAQAWLEDHHAYLQLLLELAAIFRQRWGWWPMTGWLHDDRLAARLRTARPHHIRPAHPKSWRAEDAAT